MLKRRSRPAVQSHLAISRFALYGQPRRSFVAKLPYQSSPFACLCFPHLAGKFAVTNPLLLFLSYVQSTAEDGLEQGLQRIFRHCNYPSDQHTVRRYLTTLHWQYRITNQVFDSALFDSEL
jgi:hypothetical protein